jgi:hypothetical protein
VVIEPVISEQWIFEGGVSDERPDAEDALYIKPLVKNRKLLHKESRVLHSLVLDNNVFIDLLKNRRTENNLFLENLVRTTSIELNPFFALIEQRQNPAGASDDLLAYAEYIEKTFGHSEAKHGAAAFEAALDSQKIALTANIELLSGYLPATIFIYHQTARAKEKLEWFAGLIKNADLPYFQLHFYFAALVFLVKESPELFNSKDVKKVVSDMKIDSTIEKQKKKVLNLSNDLVFPAMALIHSGVPADVLVLPYIATRDRLVQLFLSQVYCQEIADIGGGRSNGSWILMETSLLAKHLGDAIAEYMPKRMNPSSIDDMQVRKSRLQAFGDLYTSKSVIQ